jgi:shikimate kinase
MGAGKSTVGKRLAKRLAVSFFDSDHVVEERCGTSISNIFEVEGEAAFRLRESRVIDDLTSGLEPCVIATGGGAVLSAANRQVMRSRGTVIYLHASPELLFERVAHDHKRPLLKTDDRLGTLRRLYEQRHPLYLESAHHVVQTGGPSLGNLLNQIAGFLSIESGP